MINSVLLNLAFGCLIGDLLVITTFECVLPIYRRFFVELNAVIEFSQ